MVNADDKPQNVTDAPQRGSRLKRFVISTLRILAIGYVTILVMLVLMESRMVYPAAYMNTASSDLPGVKRVEYVSADGTKLTGQLFDNPDGQHTILFFHGNGTTAQRRSHHISQIGREFNASVLAAEYRGYDGLSGSPGETGLVLDAFAARDFLADHYGIPANQLIVYGESLGGGCAVAVAGDSGAKLLMLDRTFDRMVDVAAGKYWFVPVRLLMRNRYDSIARIEKYDGPVVQWHGKADGLIPIEHGKRLHSAAPTSEKFFIAVDAMGHNDPCPDQEWQEVSDRIQQCLGSADQETP